MLQTFLMSCQKTEINRKETKSNRKLWCEMDGIGKNTESGDNEGELCRREKTTKYKPTMNWLC